MFKSKNYFLNLAYNTSARLFQKEKQADYAHETSKYFEKLHKIQFRFESLELRLSIQLPSHPKFLGKQSGY